jgi:probable F420-dependent oxidoreductase
MDMKIGIFGIGSGICADPGVAARVAQAAERAGLESLWTGEHVVLPDPQVSPSPAAPLFPMLHPSTVLAYVAAVTSRVKLGTGIVLIAQRNPVVLAKEMASLDVLSRGRLILGIGAGYLEPEFRALGVPFRERGARTDEYIAAMRVLWSADKPAFEGKFVNFAGIQARPQPAQAGGPPIVIGGASDAAIERAVASAQGWYGFAMDVTTATKCIERLRAVQSRVRRDPSLGELEISITPRGRVTRELVGQFASVGVHRLIALVPQDSEVKVLDAVGELGALART